MYKKLHILFCLLLIGIILVPKQLHACEVMKMPTCCSTKSSTNTKKCSHKAESKKTCDGKCTSCQCNAIHYFSALFQASKTELHFEILEINQFAIFLNNPLSDGFSNGIFVPKIV